MPWSPKQAKSGWISETGSRRLLATWTKAGQERVDF